MESYGPRACTKFIKDCWQTRPRSSQMAYDTWVAAHKVNEVRVTEWMDGLLTTKFRGKLDLSHPAVTTALNWAKVWFKAGEEEQNPSIETFALTPEDAEAHGVGRNWFVCWEAGPYDWGLCAASDYILPNKDCVFETYWGHDLCLVQ